MARSAQVSGISPSAPGRCSMTALRQGRFEQGNQLPYLDWVVMAQIDRFTNGRGGIERRQQAIANIADVREISPHRTVAKQRDAAPRHNRLGENPHRQIGTDARAIHAKGAQTHDRNLVQLIISQPQKFGRSFRGPVRAKRHSQRRILAKRRNRALAVHGRRRDQQESLDRMQPGRFEQYERPPDVCLFVYQGMGYAPPHAGDGAQVHDATDALLGE